MNLLSNARKAVIDTPEPKVHLSCLVSGDNLLVQVRDNGCGMSPEQMERLFVPFAGSFKEGSGLGMSLVYKFIEGMDWQIDVKSESGLGTLVQIQLPICSAEELLAPPSPQV